MKRIDKIEVVWEQDDNPDTSWLGEYSRTPAAVHIDREERGDMGCGEYRYFNMSDNYTDDTPENQQKYMEQDYQRMESLNRGNWRFEGCYAVAHIVVNSVCQRIRSGGLWGNESDMGNAEKEAVAHEQLAELGNVLDEMGFSEKAVAKAIKEMATA